MQHRQQLLERKGTNVSIWIFIIYDYEPFNIRSSEFFICLQDGLSVAGYAFCFLHPTAKLCCWSSIGACVFICRRYHSKLLMEQFSAGYVLVSTPVIRFWSRWCSTIFQNPASVGLDVLVDYILILILILRLLGYVFSTTFWRWSCRQYASE